MGDRSAIEWTDATWNPVYGCSRVSAGCQHCYAERTVLRFQGQLGGGLVEQGPHGPRWTGQVTLAERRLDMPLRWSRPRHIFVASQSDLFHEAVPDAYIDRVAAVMLWAAWVNKHRFQLLTKRPARMRDYFLGLTRDRLAQGAACLSVRHGRAGAVEATHDLLAAAKVESGDMVILPNVWLGVSVEDQATADGRIPTLLRTPASMRFVSAEPLLGRVDLTGLTSHCPTHDFHSGFCIGPCPDRRHLDWLIVGGESGPGARPMHPDWVRELRDYCRSKRIAFFFKQWGEFVPVGHVDRGNATDPNEFAWERVGKAAAGRKLDGRTWSEMPA